MSEIKSRADLFEAAAKMMRMCDEAGTRQCFKFDGNLKYVNAFRPSYDSPRFSAYEFPLAIVEGKPVFKGDELWHNFYGKCKVGGNEISIAPDNAHCFSWLPPKPRTVMVELLREDAEKIVKFDAVMHMTIGGVETRILAEACRKALEEK